MQLFAAGDNCLSFSNDGNHLLAGGVSGSVFQLSTVTWAKSEKQCSQDSLTTIAAAPNGLVFATNVSEREVALFDLATMEQHKLLLRGQSTVRDIEFSPCSNKMYYH
jgi:WD40 repeat protein